MSIHKLIFRWSRQYSRTRGMVSLSKHLVIVLMLLSSINLNASVDSDGDLLSDADELLHNTLPDNPDSDNDGMWDGYEVTYGLDPLDSADQLLDFDGDRIPNVYEFTKGLELLPSPDPLAFDPRDVDSKPRPDISPEVFIIVDMNQGADYDFDNLSDAINSIDSDYEIIHVRPGNYTGPNNRNLEISSDFAYKWPLIQSLSGARETILDAESSFFSRLFTISKPAFIDGFTVRRGNQHYQASGGAFLVTAPARIGNCILRENRSFYDGGAVRIEHTNNVVLFNCLITENQIAWQLARAAVSVFQSEAIFEYCTLFNNNLTSGISNGREVRIRGNSSVTTFTGCIVWNEVDEQIIEHTVNDGVLSINYSIVGDRGYPIHPEEPDGNGNFDMSVPPVEADSTSEDYGFLVSDTVPAATEAPTIAPTYATFFDVELHPRPAAVGGAYHIGADQVTNDIDGDGMNDTWEEDYIIAANDNDWITSIEHVCPDTSNCAPSNPPPGFDIAVASDFDGDGLSNLEEFLRETDPNDPDSDDDNLSDFYEVFVFGSNPRDSDSDDDGMPDDIEHLWSFDPNVDDSLEDPDKDGYPNVFEVMMPESSIGSEYRHLSDPHDRDSIPGFDQNPELSNLRATVDLVRDIYDQDKDKNNFHIILVKPGDANINFSLGSGPGYDVRALIVSEAGAANTIIRGTNVRVVLGNWIIDGLTFLGGIEGVRVESGAPIFRNCVVRNGGTGVSVLGGDPTFVSCSIMDNFTGMNILSSTSVVTATNCIFWNDPDGPEIDGATDNRDIRYSIVRGGHEGEGNSAGDPLLTSDGHIIVYPSEHPMANVSSALDQGTNDIAGSPTDMDDEPRPLDNSIDIGADEYIDTDGDSLPDWWEDKYVTAGFDKTDATSVDPFGNINDGEYVGPDGDQLSNFDEYRLGTSPINEDTDDDQLNDDLEIANGLDPFVPDTDGDGILDGWEVSYMPVLNPLVGDAMEDPDGDSFPNIYEYRFQTDPTDPFSFPTVTSIPINNAADGDTYLVYDSTSSTYDSLKDALGFTPPSGYTILEVLPGTYEVDGAIASGVSVPSRTLVWASSGADETHIIDRSSERSGATVRMNNVQNSALIGFTVEGNAVAGILEMNGSTRLCVENSVIRNNRSGPGISVNNTQAVFEEIAVQNNINGYEIYGGGMLIQGENHLKFKRCQWTRNETRVAAKKSLNAAYGRGGAIAILSTNGSSSTELDFESCEFVGNIAYLGGAVYMDETSGSNSSATWTNCIFRENEVISFGPTIEANPAESKQSFMGTAAAVYVGARVDAAFLHTTFAKNKAEVSATVVSEALDTNSVQIRNSILWNDTPSELELPGTGTRIVEHSIIQGGFSGAGNSATAPSLTRTGWLMAANDVGSAALLVELDIHGEVRPSTGMVDAGADQWINSDSGDDDMLPDFWEALYYDSQEPINTLESDSDGLDALAEFIGGTHPQKQDTDGDLLADGDEDLNRDGLLDVGETDPLIVDVDRDRMTDREEVEHDLNPFVFDAYDDKDGDRYPNIFEVKNGSAANNAVEVPNAQATVGDTVATIRAALTDIQVIGADYPVINVLQGTYSLSDEPLSSPAISLREDALIIAVSSDPDQPTVLTDVSSRSTHTIQAAPGAMMVGFTIVGNEQYRRFYSDINGVTVMKDCIITAANSMSDTGGGAAINGGTAIFDGCKFMGNRANAGGALRNEDAKVVMRHCTFEQNEAFSSNTEFGGGAIFSWIGAGAQSDSILSQLKLEDCQFSNGNNTSSRGGAIYAYFTSLDLNRISIAGSQANTLGGGLYLNNGLNEMYASLVNVAMVNNLADQGSAIYYDSLANESNPFNLGLVHVTLWGNASSGSFPSAFHQNGGRSHIINSIIWNDALPESRQIVGGSPPVIISSFVRGDYLLNSTPASGPIFTVNPGLDASGRINDGSNSGVDSPFDNPNISNLVTVTRDMDGAPRPLFGGVDIGAHEYPGMDGDIVGQEMADVWELDNFGTLSRDGSGNYEVDIGSEDGLTDELTDFQEFQAGTDPKKGDTDDDGLLDHLELANGTNPLNPDSDFDGMTDGYEVTNNLLPMDYDAFADNDGDRYPNIYEFIWSSGPTDTNAKLSYVTPETQDVDDRFVVVDVNDTGAEYQSISEALNAVTVPYSIILVRSGYYQEYQPRITDKHVLLIAEKGPRFTQIDPVKNVLINRESIVDGFMIAGAGDSGIYADLPWNERGLVVNSVVTDNYGYRGGGARIVKGTLAFRHCSIFENRSSNSKGHAIWVDDSNHFSGVREVDILNSIVWHHDGGDPKIHGASNGSIRYSNIENLGNLVGSFTVPSLNNVSAAPDLDPFGGLLPSDTSSRDMGLLLSYPAVDMDGETRSVVPDMGPDEIVGDADDGVVDWWEAFYSADGLVDIGDEDGDSLSNIDESYHASNPFLADSDGDGMSDGEEVNDNVPPTRPMVPDGADKPTFDHDFGIYVEGVNVDLGHNDPGQSAAVWYVTYANDGNPPPHLEAGQDGAEEFNPLSPIVVSGDTVIDAQVFRERFGNPGVYFEASEVIKGVYTIDDTALFATNGSTGKRALFWLRAEDAMLAGGTQQVASWEDSTHWHHHFFTYDASMRPEKIDISGDGSGPAAILFQGNDKLRVGALDTAYGRDFSIAMLVQPLQAHTALFSYRADALNQHLDVSLGRDPATGNGTVILSGSGLVAEIPLDEPIADGFFHSLVIAWDDDRANSNGELTGDVVVYFDGREFRRDATSTFLSSFFRFPDGKIEFFLGDKKSDNVPVEAYFREVLFFNRFLSLEDAEVLDTYFGGSSSSVVAKPVISPGSGVYSADAGSPLNVTLSHPNAGAVDIRYTLNGSDPTIGNSTVYTGTPLQITNTSTVKARAFDTSGSDFPSGIVSKTYTIDNTPPIIGTVSLNGTLLPGAENETPGTENETGLFRVQVSDQSGISRVEFYVDEILIGISTSGPNDFYTANWLLPTSSAVGPHTLRIVAIDIRGLRSESGDIPFLIEPSAPDIPTLAAITSGGFATGELLTVHGTVPNTEGPGTQVDIRYDYYSDVNADPSTEPDLGDQAFVTGITVNTQGIFRSTQMLTQGQGLYVLRARAYLSSGPASSFSIPLEIVRDLTIPDSPEALFAEARQVGAVSLFWVQSPDDDAIKFQVYRAPGFDADFASAGSPIATVVEDKFYVDFPPLGLGPEAANEFSYWVIALNGSDVPSQPSPKAVVAADARGPSARLSFESITGTEVGLPQNRYGLGDYRVTLVVDEPLLAAPFLTIVPANGPRIPIALRPTANFTETFPEYDGIVTFDNVAFSSLVPGAPDALVSFSGRDLAGNRGAEVEVFYVDDDGTELTFGNTIEIETDGPAVTALSLEVDSVAASDAIMQNVGGPSTEVKMTITLDEPSVDPQDSGLVIAPDIRFLLEGAPVTTEVGNLTVVSADSMVGEQWDIEFSLELVAGNPPKWLSVKYTAYNDIGVPGTSFKENVLSEFLVYHRNSDGSNNLAGLLPPKEFTATPMSDGAIQLEWAPVEGASGYRIYRGADGASLSELVELSGGLTVTHIDDGADTPAGTTNCYLYAVAAIQNLDGNIAAIDPMNAEMVNILPMTVISDRCAPPAVTNPTAGAHPQGWGGAYVSWDTAIDNACLSSECSVDTVTYEIYRVASVGTIPDEADRLAFPPSSQNFIIDSYPEPLKPHYAIVTVDAVGNRSYDGVNNADIAYTPEAIGFTVMPVRNLALKQLEDNGPIEVTWEEPFGSDVEGYKFYLGTDLSQDPIRNGPYAPVSTSHAPLSYRYTDYRTGNSDRAYTIIAKGSGANESPPTQITLPDVSYQLKSGETLKRGVMNELTFNIENNTLETRPMQVTVLLGDCEDPNAPTFSSGFIDVNAASPQVPFTELSVPVPGNSVLPVGTIEMCVVLEIAPYTRDASQRVFLQRTFEIPVEEQALQVNVYADNLYKGEEAKLRFSVTNTGEREIELVTATFFNANLKQARASEDIIFRLEDDEGNHLGDEPNVYLESKLLKTVAAVDDIRTDLFNGESYILIPPGETYLTDVSDAIPVNIPSDVPDQLNLVLELKRVYHNRAVLSERITLETDITFSVPVNLKVPEYIAEVTAVTPTESDGTTDVMISGVARYTLSTSDVTDDIVAPNEVVLVKIAKDGFIRTFQVETDSAGNFSFNFTPTTRESGAYETWAVHPDETERQLEGAFTIRRIVVKEPPEVKIPQNFAGFVPVPIEFPSGDPVTIDEISVVNCQSGTVISSINVNPDAVVLVNRALNGDVPPQPPISQSPVQLSDLSFTAPGVLYVPIEPTAEHALGAGSACLRFETSQGETEVNFTYDYGEAFPVLSISPASIFTGVLSGSFNESIIEKITLENTGYLPLEAPQFEIVELSTGAPAPQWIQVLNPGRISRIAVGEERSLDILIQSPPSSTLVGVYQFLLKVSADGYDGFQFPINVSVNTSGQGGLAVQVVDAFSQGHVNTGFTNGVVGAQIVLQSESIDLTLPNGGINTYSTVADANGEAFLQDIPSGRYKLQVNGPSHNTFTKRIFIRPNVVQTEIVPLDYSAVSILWEVVETTIRDRYEVLLTFDFVTNVPVSTLIVQPGIVNLPVMRAGQVFQGEFVVTNMGQINADDILMNLPSGNEYVRYEFLGELPSTLAPGASVRLPYKVVAIRDMPTTSRLDPDGGTGGSSASIGGGGGSSGGGGSGVSFALAASSASAGSGGDDGSEDCFRLNDALKIDYRSNCENGLVYYHQTGGGFAVVASLAGCPLKSNPRLDEEGGGKAIEPRVLNYGGLKGGCWPSFGSDCWTCCEEESQDSGSGNNEQAGSWVDLVNREYQDTINDLEVRTSNGIVDLRRDYWGQAWHWWHDVPLEIKRMPDGVGIASITLARLKLDVANPGRTLFRSASGNTEISVLPDGNLELMRASGDWRIYNSSGLMIAWGKEEEGTMAQIQRAPDGKTLAIQDASGEDIFTFNYDPTNPENVAQVVDRFNRIVDYEYSGNMQFSKVYGPHDNGVTTAKGREVRAYEYSNGALAHKTYTVLEGSEEVVVEDIEITWNKAAVSSVTGGPEGDKFFLWDYNSSNGEFYARVTYGSGRVIEHFFDRFGNPVERIESGRPVMSATETSTSRSETDLLGNRKTTKYNALGLPTFMEEADGALSTTEYDPVTNKVLKEVDARGKITTYEYDASGYRVTRRTETTADGLLSRTWQRDYDAEGRLTRMTDPDPITGTSTGKAVVYLYEDARFPEKVTRQFDPNDGNRTLVSHEYDERGHRVATTNANEITTRYEYDLQDRLVKEIRAFGTPEEVEARFTYQGKRIRTIEQGRQGEDKPGRVTRHTYDARGWKTATHRVGTEGSEQLVMSMIYDEEGRVIAQSDALGTTTEFVYDQDGRMLETRVPAPSSSGSDFTIMKVDYDEQGRKIREYAAYGSPDEIITEYEYDSRNRVKRLIEAVGTEEERSTINTYDKFGDLVRVEYPNAKEDGSSYFTAYSYDDFGRQIGVNWSISGDAPLNDDSGARQYPQKTTYDLVDNVKTQTIAHSVSETHTTQIFYDLENRPIRTELPAIGVADLHSRAAYDKGGRTVMTSDGRGYNAYTYYDALGRATHQSIPTTADYWDEASYTWTTAWWTDDTLVLQRTVYDRFDQVLETWGHPDMEEGATGLVQLSSADYDEYGRLRTQTDPSGLTITYFYNNIDQVIRVEYPPVSTAPVQEVTAEITEYDSNAPHVVAAQVDRNGLRTELEYDALTRVIKQETSTGVTNTNFYDDLGRVIKTIVTGGTAGDEVTDYFYDRFGQAIQIIHPDHQAGTSPGDEGYRVESTTYDRFGNVLTQSGAGQYPIAFSYDLAGNRTTMTTYYGPANDAAVTTWEYNSRNQVSNKIYADTSEYLYIYDAIGNLKTRTDANGASTQYVYDNNYSLLTKIDYPNDVDVNFTYNDAGRRETMTDGTGVTSWTYDIAGRVKTATQISVNRRLEYNYDNEGNRTLMQIYDTTTDALLNQTDYTYDASGRLKTLTDDAVHASTPFVYDYRHDASWVERVTTPRGSYQVTNYTNLGQISNVQGYTSNDTQVSFYGYEYDLAGQRTRIEAPYGSIDVAYDEKRQIQSATRADDAMQPGSYDYQFNFDALGNRSGENTVGYYDDGAGASTRQTKGFATNNLNQIDFIYTDTNDNGSWDVGEAFDDFAYDNNGNLENAVRVRSGEQVSYVYDDENQLLRIDYLTGAAAGTATEFVYDGLGRRIQTRELDTLGMVVERTGYAYDGLLVIQEYNLSNQTLIRHLTRGLDLSGSMQGTGGIGGILATSNASSVQGYFFFDGNGNTVNLIDDNDSVVATYEYDPFGNRIDDSTDDFVNNPYQWSSKETHGKSGLVYYLYRYYSAELGRWINRDPLEEAGGLNLYSMVGNSPLRNIDAFGQFSWFRCAFNFVKGAASNIEDIIRLLLNLGAAIDGFIKLANDVWDGKTSVTDLLIEVFLGDILALFDRPPWEWNDTEDCCLMGRITIQVVEFLTGVGGAVVASVKVASFFKRVVIRTKAPDPDRVPKLNHLEGGSHPNLKFDWDNTPPHVRREVVRIRDRLLELYRKEHGKEPKTYPDGSKTETHIENGEAKIYRVRGRYNSITKNIIWEESATPLVQLEELFHAFQDMRKNQYRYDRKKQEMVMRTGIVSEFGAEMEVEDFLTALGVPLRPYDPIRDWHPDPNRD